MTNKHTQNTGTQTQIHKHKHTNTNKQRHKHTQKQTAKNWVRILQTVQGKPTTYSKMSLTKTSKKFDQKTHKRIGYGGHPISPGIKYPAAKPRKKER